jgi:hypothetical protein
MRSLLQRFFVIKQHSRSFYNSFRCPGNPSLSGVRHYRISEEAGQEE